MKRVVMRLINAVAFASVLITFTESALGDPPVLKWDDAAGTNVWNSTVTNWLDSADSNVVWQSGAQALFEGSGGAVKIEEDIYATNLSFNSSGYVLSGTNLLTVEGTVSTSNTTDNTIASALYSVAGIDKTGDGTLTLSNPNLTLYATLNALEGTLALQDTAIPGTVSISNPAELSVLSAATNGLMGFYYSVTRDSSDYASLEAMEAHFSRYTPNLAASSSLVGSGFDFGGGALFPLPYGTGGSREEYFEAVWRGTITIPESDNYNFRVTHDDGFLLAFDGRMVMNRLQASVTEGAIYLEAGAHDIVLGLYQGTSASGMKVEVKKVDETTYATLPNSWLSPYTTVNSLSGDGTISLADSGSAFNMKQVPDTTSTFSGDIDSPTDSIFTKSGWGDLTLSSLGTTSNTIAGNLAVMGGGLKLSAPERIGDSSKLTVGGESFIKLPEDETIGSLAGSGTAILGGNSYVYVSEFTSDANSGISTNKTYTHLLDFPADNLPATINGVEFIAAGMSGSTNGYSWSTVRPPTGAWANSGTGLDQLLYDFYYGSKNFILTLSGLTPGQNYETRLLFRSFGSVNPYSPRDLNFSFSAGDVFIGSIEYNPDTIARSAVVCRYTADESGTLSVRVIAHATAHTCHVYALSNEETGEEAVVQTEPTSGPEGVEFSGDAGSGISVQKTYTHKLDFPNNGNPATVNGVTFVAAGMSGSSDGYYWSTTGTAPTAAWNSSPYDYFYTGVARLVWDFTYNSQNYTIHLSGLHPGQAYETRLYFRSYGAPVPDSPRDVTFTFTAGATSLGSVDHDLDSMAQSMVRCSYTADSAGTISINVYSPDAGHTCHLYGLTNEELYKPATLTINTPAGTSAFHSGSILGRGTIVKQGEGTQTLACANRLSAPLDVQEGILAFAPGASVAGGVTVAAGATVLAPKGDVHIKGLSGAGTFSLAPTSTSPVENMINIKYFTDDLTTGISPSKVYTHLMDLGTRSNVAVINGVTFNKVSSQSGTINGYGWGNFPPSSHPGSVNNEPSGEHGVPTDSGVYDLLYDMNYGWSWPNPQTMQLTGLTPGKQYEVHLFNRTWGWGGSRTQTVTFDPDGSGPISESVTFNPDQMDPNYVSYRYTAVSSTLEITILSAMSNQTLHLYGLTNEEVSDPVTVEIVGDSVFPGSVTGSGAWHKNGAGTLTLTGTGDASGNLTISEGALGISDGGTATTGDISVESGATLFGSGSLGGNVSIASNAVIHAGTTNVCGSMVIGTSLTLEPGAMPTWRYESGSNDTIIVNGLLTFPSNGVLQVEGLTAGLKAPSKATVFSSTEIIDGPDDLSGWTVAGEIISSLAYSADRTEIYFIRTNGTLIMIQ